MLSGNLGTDGTGPNFPAAKLGERPVCVPVFPRLADYPSRIAVYAQNSSRAWKAIMRGLLSPPSPTPSNPVGGEVVYASAPNPLCVEGFPGIPACTMLGSAKFGWLKTLKN